MFSVHPGREVVRQGELYPDAWVVRSGAFLMEAVDEEGRRLVLDVLGPGDLVGGPATWTADASVRALVPGELFAAGSVSIRDGLARRARRGAALACAIAWHPVSDRVVFALEDLVLRFGRPARDGRRIALPITQEHLAAMTGATRESVNRALMSLVAQGRVCRDRRRYVIPSGSTSWARRPA
jgi:CRP-like cAMP-binding protein